MKWHPLSVCLSACLSVSLSVCLSVCHFCIHLFIVQIFLWTWPAAIPSQSLLKFYGNRRLVEIALVRKRQATNSAAVKKLTSSPLAVYKVLCGINIYGWHSGGGNRRRTPENNPLTTHNWQPTNRQEARDKTSMWQLFEQLNWNILGLGIVVEGLTPGNSL